MCSHLALLTYLQKCIPHLQAVYRFGDLVRGFTNDAQSYDLAVLSKEPLRLTLLWDIANHVHEHLGYSLDVVDLRSMDTQMQVQILRMGERIWYQNRVEVCLYELLVLNDQLDLLQVKQRLSMIKEKGFLHEVL